MCGGIVNLTQTNCRTLTKERSIAIGTTGSIEYRVLQTADGRPITSFQSANRLLITSRYPLAEYRCLPTRKCDKMGPKADRNRPGVTRGLEPPHHPFSQSCRLMRILCPIVLILLLKVLNARHYFSFCRVVAFQLVGNDYPRDIPQSLQKLAKELLRGLLIPLALD